MNRSKNVDLYYDIIDSACMLLNKDLNIDYLHALIRVAKDLTIGFDDSLLDLTTVRKLESLYQKLENNEFVNEDIRQGLQLLVVKGLKHYNQYNLDILTPDTINYLFAFFIDELIDNETSILDISLKTGNMLNAISNYIKHNSSLIGIESEALLCEVAYAFTVLEGNCIKIYNNKAIDPILDYVDIVIGELENETINEEYLPYKLINKFNNNLNPNGYFIYLIDNKFFTQSSLNNFKTTFTGTLLGLIVLPDNMFKPGQGKSILIGTNENKTNFEMLVLQIKDINDKIKLQETIAYLRTWIKDMKG